MMISKIKIKMINKMKVKMNNNKMKRSKKKC